MARDGESSIQAEIETAGWSVRNVQGPPGGYPSSYTVGLTRFALPEIVVYGIASSDEATQLLNRVAQRALQALSSSHAACLLVAGTVLCDLFEGVYPVTFVDVDDIGAHLPMASLVFAHDSDLRAVQLVLPDERLRWPWNPLCDFYDDMPIAGPVPAHLTSSN